MTTKALVLVVATLLWSAARTAQGRDATLLDLATTYVVAYEHAFSLLVSDEHYVQEIRRPLSAGSNLSRSNPGGGTANLGAGTDGRDLQRSEQQQRHLATAKYTNVQRFQVSTGEKIGKPAGPPPT